MNISELRGYKEFKAVCNYDLCKKYYPNWVGGEKYIIVTDCTEESLKTAFPEIMTALSPYVIIGKYFNKMNESMRYGDKKEQEKTEYSIDAVEDFESLSERFWSNDFSEELFLSDQIINALNLITPTQKSRIMRKYYEGMTFQEIAAEDNVDFKTVWESIKSGLKVMKKYFNQ